MMTEKPRPQALRFLALLVRRSKDGTAVWVRAWNNAVEVSVDNHSVRVESAAIAKMFVFGQLDPVEPRYKGRFVITESGRGYAEDFLRTGEGQALALRWADEDAAR